ncbi:hypothetical protein AAES_25053 [Amazona aestiva]|uniref:Uncharacterized protein n=1 Tax=Amazona aestiva TaxID=12930 RepID=A0A0Q3X381_AMAAE|nr:hypothetical protein AAES_25053 [Amazona aestiva]
MKSKISSPPTFCDIHKNIFTSIVKHVVNIYKDLYIDMMLSAGSVVYPNIAKSEQKRIMFLTLSTVKIKVIKGMSSGTLPKLYKPPGFPFHLSAGVSQQAGIQ